MLLTKQQRLCFGVLAIAVAAWVTDRFILHGGVTQPSAAQASLLITHEAPALSPVSNMPVAASSESSFAQRLEQFSAQLQDPASPAPDAFTPPSSWLPQQAAPSAVGSTPGLSPSEFRQSHPLTAIIRAGKKSEVFMGASMIRLGERIDGFTLISVTEVTALFESNGAEVTLYLDNPATNPPVGHPVASKADRTSLPHIAQ